MNAPSNLNSFDIYQLANHNKCSIDEAAAYAKDMVLMGAWSVCEGDKYAAWPDTMRRMRQHTPRTKSEFAESVEQKIRSFAARRKNNGKA